MTSYLRDHIGAGRPDHLEISNDIPGTILTSPPDLFDASKPEGTLRLRCHEGICVAVQVGSPNKVEIPIPFEELIERPFQLDVEIHVDSSISIETKVSDHVDTIDLPIEALVQGEVLREFLPDEVEILLIIGQSILPTWTVTSNTFRRLFPLVGDLMSLPGLPDDLRNGHF